MTDCTKWLTRKEMGQFMEGYGSSKQYVTIKLPTMKYYSKLVFSNISGLMTEQNEQLSSHQVWSGLRSLSYSLALIDSFKQTPSTAKTHGKDIQSLASNLALELAKLVDQYGDGQKINMGTIKWRSTEGLGSGENALGEETKHCPHLSGKYNLSR